MRCIWMRHHRNSTRQRSGALDTLNGQSDLFNKKCALIRSDHWIKPTRRNNSRYRLWNIGIHNIYGVLCWLACPLPASVPMPDKLISVMDNIKNNMGAGYRSRIHFIRNARFHLKCFVKFKFKFKILLFVYKPNTIGYSQQYRILLNKSIHL